MTSTEYRNKKNEQNAKLLNKYKEKYLNRLNVDKKYVKKKFNKSMFKEGVKKIHTITWATSSMQNLAGSALFLPQGGTHFQLVPLGSPQGYFMGKFSPLTSIKFLPPMPEIAPHPKVIQIIRPWKNLRDLKKIDFQHTSVDRGGSDEFSFNSVFHKNYNS